MTLILQFYIPACIYIVFQSLARVVVVVCICKYVKYIIFYII